MIAFELVAVDTRFYWARILVIGYQYVNKESQDFRYYSSRIFLADLLPEWSKNMTRILPWRFNQSFRPINMLTLHKCSDTGRFRHLSNPAFCSLQFQKQITSEAHIFFKVSQILCKFRKCRKKLRKYFSIAFDLVAVDTRFYWARILVIGYHYVNKESQDFRY